MLMNKLYEEKRYEDVTKVYRMLNAKNADKILDPEVYLDALVEMVCY